MRQLRATGRFERRLATFLKRHPELEDSVTSAIDALASDKRPVSLRVHKLHGVLAGCFAARIGQAYRLVFVVEPDALGLIDIGSHDDVYR